MKKALIFGVTGQDGSYLAEQLLKKDYFVQGVIRRSSSINTPRIDHLMDSSNFKTCYGDVTDPVSVNGIISSLRPDEIYGLAAQSHVKVSFEIPYYTAQVDAVGTLNILEAVRLLSPHTRVYQASTSEMFGGMGYNMPEGGYTEESLFHPRSPYGVAKLYAYWIMKNYRESYNTFACNGLLFNHESPRRGETFVTRKITLWCGKNYQSLKNGKFKNIHIAPLTLGNIGAFRDWGHAADYTEAMQLMLQQDKPDDYVVATGETHTVKEFVSLCFNWMGLKLEWEGVGDKEVGKVDGIVVVKIDPKYYRPSEVEYLLGNPAKAKKVLNWTPKFSFIDLVNDMMNNDVAKGLA
jgi:GDPmannose 4,6-dehydratase